MHTGTTSHTPATSQAAPAPAPQSSGAAEAAAQAHSAVSPMPAADGREKRRKRVAAQLKDLQQCYLALRSQQQQQERRQHHPSAQPPSCGGAASAQEVPRPEANLRLLSQRDAAFPPSPPDGAAPSEPEQHLQQPRKEAEVAATDSSGHPLQGGPTAGPSGAAPAECAAKPAAASTVAAARAEAGKAAGAGLLAAAAAISGGVDPHLTVTLPAKRPRLEPLEGLPLASSGVEPRGLAEFSRMLSVFTHFGSLQVCTVSRRGICLRATQTCLPMPSPHPCFLQNPQQTCIATA